MKAVSRPGDLGRRVGWRRRELGLGVEELAERAGMAPGFLDYIESRPADLNAGTLARLAAALDTSRADLLGGEADAAPGRGGGDRRTVLAELTPEECRRHLSGTGVGRIVFQADDGALIVRPVNYRLIDDAVLFRTETHGTLASAVGSKVVLEVDHIDEATAHGWSVLVSGRAEAVTEDVHWPDVRLGLPQPWAGGPRALVVWIRPALITGRVLRTGPPAEPEGDV